MRTHQSTWMGLLALCGMACTDPAPDLTLSGFSLPTADDAMAVPLSDFLMASEETLRGCANGEPDTALTYAAIEVGPTAIRMENGLELALVNGKLPTSDVNGQHIIRLYEALNKGVEATTSVARRQDCKSLLSAEGFTGRLLLVAHPDTPFSLMRQVIYTAGQAQFGEFYLMVDDPTPSPASETDRLTLHMPLNPSVLELSPHGISLGTRDQSTAVGRCLRAASCRSSADFDWSGVGQALLEHKGLNPSQNDLLVVPHEDTAWSTIVQAFDISRTHLGTPLFPDVVISGGHSSTEERTQARRSLASHSQLAPQTAPLITRSGWPRSLPADAHIAVHRTFLPAIGAPADPSSIDMEDAEASAREEMQRDAKQSSLLAILGSRGSLDSPSTQSLFDQGPIDSPLEPAAREALQPSLRQWFPETFLFAPLLTTGDDGTATVDVTLPDQLTDWRVLGLAHDATGRLAGSLGHLQTTLPAYVEVRPLPVLRVGDSVDLPIRVVNHSPTPLLTRLAVDAAQRPALSTGIALDPHDTLVQTLPIRPSKAGQLKVRATIGQRDTTLDVMEQTLEVVPAGRQRIASVGGVLGSARTVSLSPAPDSAASTTELLLLPGTLGVLRWELGRVTGLPASSAAEQAYVATLAARADLLAQAAGVLPAAEQSRRRRLEALQLLTPAAMHPSLSEAVTLLRGVALLDDPVAHAMTRRLVAQLEDAQAPDGSFPHLGESTLDEVLVFAAQAALSTAAHSPQVQDKVRGLFARHQHQVRDAHTAAAMLSTGLIAKDQQAPLLTLVQDAIQTRADGTRMLVPERWSVNADGQQPDSLEGTATAVMGLHAAGITPPSELLDTLLAAHDPDTGFGEATAGLRAIEALSIALQEPMPEQVSVQVKSGERVLVEQLVSLGEPLSLPIPTVPGADTWTVATQPPVPGLAFRLVRTDWVVPPVVMQGDRLQVDVPAAVGLGEVFELRIQVAVGEALAIDVRLPAGIDADISELEGRSDVARAHQQAGVVRAELIGGSGLVDLRIPLVATLSGRLQWGGVAAVAGDELVSVGLPPLLVRGP